MPSPDRGPLDTAKAFAWSMLLISALLWGAAWLLSQIWVWLLVLVSLIGIITAVLWWVRARRDRW
jgi:Flp pilus assembly protein TadB